MKIVSVQGFLRVLSNREYRLRLICKDGQPDKRIPSEVISGDFLAARQILSGPIPIDHVIWAYISDRGPAN